MGIRIPKTLNRFNKGHTFALTADFSKDASTLLESKLLAGGSIGDHVGDYYEGLFRGMQGFLTIAHMHQTKAYSD